jgi:hypothetical protein
VVFGLPLAEGVRRMTASNAREQAEYKLASSVMIAYINIIKDEKVL